MVVRAGTMPGAIPPRDLSLLSSRRGSTFPEWGCSAPLRRASPKATTSGAVVAAEATTNPDAWVLGARAERRRRRQEWGSEGAGANNLGPSFGLTLEFSGGARHSELRGIARWVTADGRSPSAATTG